MKRSDRDANDEDPEDHTSSRPHSMNIVRDAFGVVGITFCILVGSFITVMSCADLADGEEDPLLYLYISIGVILIITGLYIMHKMTRGDVEQVKAEEEKDEEW